MPRLWTPPTAEQLLALGVAAPRIHSGRWSGPVGQSLSTAIPTEAQLRLLPVFLPPATWDRIRSEVTVVGTAGALIRLGLYYDDGTGVPGALALDAGTIDGTSATAQEINVNLTLPGGLYWIGSVVQGAALTRPTTRQLVGPVVPVSNLNSTSNMGRCYLQSSVTGALPNPYGGFSASEPAGAQGTYVTLRRT